MHNVPQCAGARPVPKRSGTRSRVRLVPSGTSGLPLCGASLRRPALGMSRDAWEGWAEAVSRCSGGDGGGTSISPCLGGDCSGGRERARAQNVVATQRAP
jgi:hypothetical protein